MPGQQEPGAGTPAEGGGRTAGAAGSPAAASRVLRGAPGGPRRKGLGYESSLSAALAARGRRQFHYSFPSFFRQGLSSMAHYSGAEGQGSGRVTGNPFDPNLPPQEST